MPKSKRTEPRSSEYPSTFDYAIDCGMLFTMEFLLRDAKARRRQRKPVSFGWLSENLAKHAALILENPLRANEPDILLPLHIEPLAPVRRRKAA